MASLQSIENKIDRLGIETNNNGKNIAVIEEHLRNQNDNVKKTIETCSLTRQNYSKRIGSLERNSAKRMGIYIGASSIATSIVTAATVTKAIGLW